MRTPPENCSTTHFYIIYEYNGLKSHKCAPDYLGRHTHDSSTITLHTF